MSNTPKQGLVDRALAAARQPASTAKAESAPAQAQSSTPKSVTTKSPPAKEAGKSPTTKSSGRSSSPLAAHLNVKRLVVGILAVIGAWTLLDAPIMAAKASIEDAYRPQVSVSYIDVTSPGATTP